MNEEIKNAMVELENWLSDPQELGKKPVKIEYANSFEDEDNIKCIFLNIRKYKQKIRIKMQNKDYMIQKIHSRFRNVGKKEQYNVF